MGLVGGETQKGKGPPAGGLPRAGQRLGIPLSADAERAAADEPPDDDPGPTHGRRVSARGDRPLEVAPAIPAVEPTPALRRTIITYTVTSGDNVARLAERFGISPATIVGANRIGDPERLEVSQELTILPVSGVLHAVVEGDTVSALATRYRVIPEAILKVNELPADALIRVGQRLGLPL